MQLTEHKAKSVYNKLQQNDCFHQFFWQSEDNVDIFLLVVSLFYTGIPQFLFFNRLVF